MIGLVRVTRAALPALRASAHAAIVNLSSIGAPLGLYRRALYDASKGAVHSLTLAMAADYLEEGIRVNCVVPGTADTPWVARLLAQAADPQAERAALIARQPHGRLVTPEEVAAAIAFLANPRSGSITGTALAVDGGMTTLRLPPGRRGIGAPRESQGRPLAAARRRAATQGATWGDAVPAVGPPVSRRRRAAARDARDRSGFAVRRRHNAATHLERSEL